MPTRVICISGVNIGNRRLIGTQMEGCQVRDWIISRMLYTTYVNGG